MAREADSLNRAPGHGNPFHWPRLGPDGKCTHLHTRPYRRCGQERDGDNHLFYPCLAKGCHQRFWSIDSRVTHMEEDHG